MTIETSEDVHEHYGKQRKEADSAALKLWQLYYDGKISKTAMLKRFNSLANVWKEPR